MESLNQKAWRIYFSSIMNGLLSSLHLSLDKESINNAARIADIMLKLEETRFPYDNQNEIHSDE
jgi:hypothetical protein